jgi:hypothetical protein
MSSSNLAVKPVFRFDADSETTSRYPLSTTRHTASSNRGQSNADHQPHPGLAVILFGPSLAGSTDDVAGIGSVSHNSAPVGINLPEVTVIAGLTHAVRS